jgi:tetratricopeptide (TPR) repeat protein
MMVTNMRSLLIIVLLTIVVFISSASSAKEKSAVKKTSEATNTIKSKNNNGYNSGPKDVHKEGSFVAHDQVEYDKAIKQYSESIELNPNDASAYNNRGMAWDKKGEYDKAINDYSKALELNPNAEVYSNRGTVWNEKATATKQYRISTRQSPLIRILPKLIMEEEWHLTARAFITRQLLITTKR